MERINIKSAFAGLCGRRDDNFLSITMEAVRAAMSAGDLSSVRHIYIASYAPEKLCDLPDPFGLITTAIASEFRGLRATCHGLYKTGGEALFAALEERAAHSPDGDVIVVGSEKMSHLDPAVAAGHLSGRENDHDARYGATLPALGGLVTSAYLDRYGVPEAALHHVAVKNHGHAAMNPKAHFQKAVTLEEVACSPLVADPLRRLHCAPISDGAAAVRLSSDPAPSSYIGWGRGLDTHLLQERADVARFAATARASTAALQMASVSHDDIDIVEIHDAFSSFELLNLEEMGFYDLGTSWRALVDGDLTINGKLAVNPSGGMKAKGHPIGATGLSASAELCTQLSGTAGRRQHTGARFGMIQSVGGVSRESYVFVIGGGGA